MQCNAMHACMCVCVHLFVFRECVCVCACLCVHVCLQLCKCPCSHFGKFCQEMIPRLQPPGHGVPKRRRLGPEQFCFLAVPTTDHALGAVAAKSWRIVGFGKLVSCEPFKDPSQQEREMLHAMSTHIMFKSRAMGAYEFPVKMHVNSGGWLSGDPVICTRPGSGQTAFNVLPEIEQALGQAQVAGRGQSVRQLFGARFAGWPVMTISSGIHSDVETADCLKFRVVYLCFDGHYLL